MSIADHPHGLHPGDYSVDGRWQWNGYEWMPVSHATWQQALPPVGTPLAISGSSGPYGSGAPSPRQPNWPQAPFPAGAPYVPPRRKPAFPGWLIALFAVAGSIALIFMILVAVGIASSGSGSSAPTFTQDYRNANYLATSVTARWNEIAASEGRSWRAQSTECIKFSAQQFKCHTEFSDGDQKNVTVTVSEDGQTWMSGD